MLTAEQNEKLAALHNYATRYEVVAVHGDRKLRLGYTARHSRAGLLNCIRGHGEALVALTGAEDMTFGRNIAAGATIGAWTVRFSGRTQREAITHGELEAVGGATR